MSDLKTELEKLKIVQCPDGAVRFETVEEKEVEDEQA